MFAISTFLLIFFILPFILPVLIFPDTSSKIKNAEKRPDTIKSGTKKKEQCFSGGDIS